MRRHARWIASFVVTIAVVTGVCQAVAFIAAPHAAKAAAAPVTGTAGMFVPLQGRLIDTRSNVGLSGKMTANTWRSFQVEGAGFHGQSSGPSSVPASGVSAVLITATVLNQTDQGNVYAHADGAGGASNLLLLYSPNGIESNDGIVRVADNGKIDLETTTATDLVIDIQGYYTSGNGDTAAGGYVPVTPTKFVSTSTGLGAPKATLSTGQSITVKPAGVAGVPTTASAVFVNIIASSSSGGGLYAYAAGATRPTSTLNWPSGGDPYAMGTQVPISSDGKLTISIAAGSGLNLDIFVSGYFSPGSSAGSFTPVATRLYDSRTSPNTAIPANSTRSVQIAGVNGVPRIGSGLSAVAANISAYAATGSGSLRVWGDGRPDTGATTLNYDPNNRAWISNFVTTQLGANGAVSVRNLSSSPVTFIIDLEGWYTSVAGAVPNGQNQTQRALTLQGSSNGGGSYVTYQYRTGTTGSFSNVPAGNVTPAPAGNAWPEAISGSSFAKHVWDLQQSLGAANKLVQIVACYGTSATDTSPACSSPNNINYTPADFSTANATQDIGPGSLSLATGNFQLSASDASASTALGSLSVGRSLTTLAPATASSGPASVFGPGWTADLTGPDGGEADMTVKDNSADGYIDFFSPDNGDVLFVADPTTPNNYLPAGDDTADDSDVVTLDTGTTPARLTWKEGDGTTTTWTKNGSGTTATWPVTSVDQPGSGATTTYTYNTDGLVSRILAPTGGVDCSSPDSTAGCRSLKLVYGDGTTGPTGRLVRIDLSIPQTTGTANAVPVEQYSYDSSNRLQAAWDPRLTPNVLKTTYGYDGNNRLTTVTPPGLAAWSFGYDGKNRLTTVSRPAPGLGTATTTIVYDVTTAGGGNTGLPDLSGTTPGTWGETGDLPIDKTAVAIFDPDHNPGATATATDWPYASINYLDTNSRIVNTASYGAAQWLIDTTQYDDTGNTVWSLTAGNRAQALTPTADTDSYVAAQTTAVGSVPASAVRAGLLTSNTKYNPLVAGQITDTYGPAHPITLSDGTAIHGRSHVATSYDDGAPNSDINPATNEPYDLPTTVVTSASRVDGASGDTNGADSQTTKTGYDPIKSGDKSGWDLGQPTTSTVVMLGGADLVTRSRYDGNGRLIEQRLPNDADGSTPRTTLTSYYTADGSGVCGSAPTKVGLVCSTAPAAQPSSGAALPVTSYSYNQYGDPAAKTETYGTGSAQAVRTTTTGYDEIERPVTSSITVTPTSAGGTALPAVTTAYAQSTGLPTSTSTTSGGVTTSLVTGYDNLGRTTSYTDATGNVSTTTYDVSGNVASVNDGKHITSYTTDSGSEHRDLTMSEDIGVTTAPSTFAADYDAAGNMTTETYPNGLVATRRYDNVGNMTSLNYTKDGSSWMTFTQDINALDQVTHQTSPQSAQNFRYDAADRLTNVQDSYQNACTTRTYSYDAHSNRTRLATNPAAGDGSCSNTTTPAATDYNYDAADRLTSDTAGAYSYDALGRATQIPAGDARGTGRHATVTGNATLAYDVNDMVGTQTQGGSTNTFTLDPAQDRINTQTEGTGTTVNHYDSDDDSPAWAGSGSGTSATWTEYKADLAGNFVASINQANTVSFQLSNPHGDVVATVSDTANATAPSGISETTEYGLPRDAAPSPDNYGWLGTKQRSENDLAGLITMGVRLYSPATGRFTAVDPVTGGNDNAYLYPDDPINQQDITGKFHWWVGGGKHKWSRRHVFKTARMLRAVAAGEEAIGTLAEFFPAFGEVVQAASFISTAVLESLADDLVYYCGSNGETVRIGFGQEHYYSLPKIHWVLHPRHKRKSRKRVAPPTPGSPRYY